MVRKFTRILLAMLVGFSLGGIMACGDSGPAEKAEQAAEKAEQAAEEMGEAVSEMGEAAKDMMETEQEKNQ